jgi:two-component system, NarL family, sensor histidine kinase EvgS
VPKDKLPRRGVICLTEKPKPTGSRVVDDTVRVSINPISWRGLGAACAAALSGLSTVPARTAAAHVTGVAPPDRERAIASGRLVLVAEDHPVNQELIRHQLALLGFARDVVNDGAEALVALGRTRYGFLITDCHMPNLRRAAKRAWTIASPSRCVLPRYGTIWPDGLAATPDRGA